MVKENIMGNGENADYQHKKFLLFPECFQAASFPARDQSHVSLRIAISQTNFVKGYPRKISVELFQNLTSGLREEEYSRISSCLYSACSPNSPESIVCEQLQKRVTQGSFL